MTQVLAAHLTWVWPIRVRQLLQVHLQSSAFTVCPWWLVHSQVSVSVLWPPFAFVLLLSVSCLTLGIPFNVILLNLISMTNKDPFSVNLPNIWPVSEVDVQDLILISFFVVKLYFRLSFQEVSSSTGSDERRSISVLPGPSSGRVEGIYFFKCWHLINYSGNSSHKAYYFLS